MNLPIDRSSPMGLVLAAVFGIIFGFLLDRGQVNRYDVIVNFFRLKNFRMLKIMLSAIIVGGIGVFVLNSMELVDFHIKTLTMGGILIGGLLFGIGMVLLGYCPGTGIAAVANGSIHGLVGVFGMLVGAILYGVSYPWMKENILSLGDYGKATLPDTGVPAFVWWIVIIAAAIFIFATLGKRKEVRD